MNSSLNNRLGKLEQRQGMQDEMCDPESQNFFGQFGYGPMTRSAAAHELRRLLTEINGSARSIPEVNHA